MFPGSTTPKVEIYKFERALFGPLLYTFGTFCNASLRLRGRLLKMKMKYAVWLGAGTG